MVEPTEIAWAGRMGGLEDVWIDKLTAIAQRIKHDDKATVMLWHWHRGLIDPGGWTAVDMQAWPAATEPELAGAYALLVLSGIRRFCEVYTARRISEAIIRDTLRDVRRAMSGCIEQLGFVGVRRMRWLTHHLTHKLVELGRLQFEIGRVDTKLDQDECERLRTDAACIESLGLKLTDPVLWIHIPKSGVLLPEACEASYALADSFFPRHFPEHRHEALLCRSWLLDPQLAEYLPVDSNIRHFQDRFEMIGVQRDTDEIQRFVFGEVYEDITHAPQKTALEHAIVQHVLAGRTWRTGLGRLKR